MSLKVVIIKDKQLMLIKVKGQYLEEGLIFKRILTIRMDIVILVTLILPLQDKLKVNLMQRVNYLENKVKKLKILKYLV